MAEGRYGTGRLPRCTTSALLVAVLTLFGCSDDDGGAACARDEECGDGRLCVEGACVSADGRDGGRDAGAPDGGDPRDSGAGDAGDPDGGADAGACIGGDCAREIVSIDGTGPRGVCVLLRSGELWCGAPEPSEPALSLVGTFEGAVAVTRGLDRACILFEEGTVECFRPGTEEPAAVPGLGDAVQVDTWAQHTCAVRSTGEVACWGQNDFGQIEDGGEPSYATAHPIASLDDAVEVATARLATCALRSGGQVSCWGDELGSSPTPVAGITGAVAITAGHFHFCARDATGSVTCFGTSLAGLESEPPEAIDDAAEVVAGHSVTCYRTAAGTVRCWGDPMSPGLTDAPPLESVVGLTDAVRLANGCALRSTGDLACWEARDTLVHLPAP